MWFSRKCSTIDCEKSSLSGIISCPLQAFHKKQKGKLALHHNFDFVNDGINGMLQSMFQMPHKKVEGKLAWCHNLDFNGMLQFIFYETHQHSHFQISHKKVERKLA